MEIHVARNGEKFGPYSADEVRARLAAGQLSGADLCWYEGLAQWVPLAGVMGGLPGGNAAPPLTLVTPANKSGLAKASFIISIVTTCVWILVFAFIAVTYVRHPDHATSREQADPELMLVGLALMGNMMVNLLGLILGLIVVFKPSSNRWMAIVGVALNGIELLGVIMLMILGLAHRHA